MSAQERRLAAIAAASADAFRHGGYHQVRAEDVAERVRLPRGGERDRGRSAVWLYNEVRSRRVLVALAVKHAFDEFTAGDAGPADSVDATGRTGAADGDAPEASRRAPCSTPRTWSPRRCAGWPVSTRWSASCSTRRAWGSGTSRRRRNACPRDRASRCGR